MNAMFHRFYDFLKIHILFPRSSIMLNELRQGFLICKFKKQIQDILFDLQIQDMKQI